MLVCKLAIKDRWKHQTPILSLLTLTIGSELLSLLPDMSLRVFWWTASVEFTLVLSSSESKQRMALVGMPVSTAAQTPSARLKVGGCSHSWSGQLAVQPGSGESAEL